MRFPTIAVALFVLSALGMSAQESSVTSMLISHGTCQDDCPVYTVRLDESGLVTYHGQGFVKVFGTKTWMVPAGEVESILGRLKRHGYIAGERAGKFAVEQGKCDGSGESSVAVMLTVDGKEELAIPVCHSAELASLAAEAEHVADVSLYATGHDEGREKAIRAVLDEQVGAWNKGDIDGFMRGYWMSKDLTFFSGGTETHGWKETLERYRKSYKSAGHEMGQLAFGELRIEMLSEDAAFVRGTWKLTMKDGKTPHGLFTLIFRKMPDGWRIVHDSTGAS